jgi:hypothetical protein
MATVLALAALVAGCKGPALGPTSAGTVHGRIEGVQKFDKDCVVQVYRLDEAGLPTPDPFETVSPDATGKFATRVLSPGRYRVVYRQPIGPPSALSVRVPYETETVLRPLVVPGLVQLKVTTTVVSLRCRLTEAAPADGIPDVREFGARSDAPVFIRGIRPGHWYLDLPETGATTEIDVPGTEALRELVVDPPPASPGGAVYGEVRRIDALAGAWMVVSARPLSPSGESASRWGRYASTDRSGAYRIVGIPPGPCLVRVECREVPVRILPSPNVATIPPSGAIQLGFVVEP